MGLLLWDIAVLRRSARLSVSALVSTSRGQSRIVLVSKIVYILVSVSLVTIGSFPVSVSVWKLSLRVSVLVSKAEKCCPFEMPFFKDLFFKNNLQRLVHSSIVYLIDFG